MLSQFEFLLFILNAIFFLDTHLSILSIHSFIDLKVSILILTNQFLPYDLCFLDLLKKLSPFLSS